MLRRIRSLVARLVGRLRAPLARIGVSARRGVERIRWGGDRRRSVLERLLVGHYRSSFRRDWVLLRPGQDPPHFFDHRINAVELGLGDGHATTWLRAFHTLDALRDGDTLLDIGCGDGFFDRHFFADRCEAIDAVDIEPSAIEHARRHEAHERVTYHQLDATRDAFPQPAYDVIVFDGALGHFPPDTTHAMLAKIATALTGDGLFVGSESLGREGTDHLQFFETIEDLAATLRRHFPVVAMKETRYTIAGGSERREAYWRCALRPDRVQAADWRRLDAPTS